MKAIRASKLPPGHPAEVHKDKVGQAMHKFKRGQLHSGSKRGPVITSREQAEAIGLSEERRGSCASGKKKK